MMAASQAPQAELQGQSESQAAPACVIRSDHPLVLHFIDSAIRSDPALSFQVNVHPGGSRPLQGGRQQVLILDTCSVENWIACIEKWNLGGGFTIVLVAAEAHTEQVELQMIYCGASGVLSFGANLQADLPRAVHAVSAGQLWNRREVLSLYVRRTSLMLREASTMDQRLTARENQVIDLVQRRISNRAIAQRLGISERTAKFHISNIFRKLNIGSRQELQSMSSQSPLLCPEWLAPQLVASGGPSLSPPQRNESPGTRPQKALK